MLNILKAEPPPPFITTESFRLPRQSASSIHLREGRDSLLNLETIFVGEMRYVFEGGGDGRGRSRESRSSSEWLRSWWRFIEYLLSVPGRQTYQLRYEKPAGADSIPRIALVVGRAAGTENIVRDSLALWHKGFSGPGIELEYGSPVETGQENTPHDEIDPSISEWPVIGEFFRKERLNAKGNYLLQPWRTRPENMFPILTSLSTFPGSIVYATTLKPVIVDEEERAFLFA